MLKPKDIGAQGSLLDKGVYDLLPTILNAGDGNETLYKKSFKVIGMRIDPCPNLLTEQACNPEMRLIWQAVVQNRGQKNKTTEDGAIHTFYKLSLSQFAELKKTLLKLKQKNEDTFNVSTTHEPLNVHPAFLNPSSHKEFTEAIKQDILKYCGSQNMLKITFMSTLVRTRWWRFGSFEKDTSGKWLSPIIPRTTDNLTDFLNTARGSGDETPAKLLMV